MKQAIRLGQKRLLRHLSVSKSDLDDERSALHFERTLRRTGSPCSGPCCGNPRRHFRAVTLQEQKATEASHWVVTSDETSELLSGFAVSKLKRRHFGRVRFGRFK